MAKARFKTPGLVYNSPVPLYSEENLAEAGLVTGAGKGLGALPTLGAGAAPTLGKGAIPTQGVGPLPTLGVGNRLGVGSGVAQPKAVHPIQVQPTPQPGDKSFLANGLNVDP